MRGSIDREWIMAQAERIEVLVLGSGTGGKHLSWDMARAGRRTVVVERRWIGGSCPNINCLPSKNEVRSAEVADVVRRAGAFGTAAGGVRIDMPQVLARKRRMVEAQVDLHREQYRTSGVELVLGQAHFVAPKTVDVALNDGGTRRLSGDRVFLNLGTHPFVPPVPGLRDVALTNIELLELDRVPERLLVLGGGYVGMEFAQAYRRFGSRVTVVERGPQVLAREDPDVAEALQRLFADEEIEILHEAQLVRVEGRRGDLRVTVRAAGAERTVVVSEVLAAAGRTPNTSGIGRPTGCLRYVVFVRTVSCRPPARIPRTRRLRRARGTSCRWPRFGDTSRGRHLRNVFAQADTSFSSGVLTTAFAPP
jgi:pyruvate/2-oxoglutarate dehydrogenase complex dihydrolipoamide dehydrogenase (E3) component